MSRLIFSAERFALRAAESKDGGSTGVQEESDKRRRTVARDRCSRESAHCACTIARGHLGRSTKTLAYPVVFGVVRAARGVQVGMA